MKLRGDHLAHAIMAEDDVLMTTCGSTPGWPP